MIEVPQSIVDFKNGNCFQACVASIFEKRLYEIPSFMENGPDCFLEKLADWTRSNNLDCIDLNVSNSDDLEIILKDTWSIGCGPSIRSDDDEKQHAVVCFSGKMVYDPIGEMQGVKEIKTHTIFVVKNPALLKDKTK